MYFQVTIPSSGESEDLLSVVAVSLKKKGCEQRPESLIAFFPESVDKGALLTELAQRIAKIRASGLSVPSSQLKLEVVPDRDWNAEWKKRLKPLQISPRFTIKPSWKRLQKAETEFVIEIDPKQAFGTGTHATTRLMIMMLERYVKAGATVLDIGTGTAILAIAAVKLGAQRGVACDIDPVAVEAAMENRQVNIPDERLALFTGTLPAIRESQKYDLILANITKNAIIPLLPGFRNHLKPDGVLLLSGILIEELPEMTDRLAANALEVIDEKHLEEWCGLVVERKSVP